MTSPALRDGAWRRARACALAFAAALAPTAAAPACGPVSVGEEPVEGPSEEPPESATATSLPDAAATSEDPLAGTWWVLARDLPLRAFRMNLVAAGSPDDPHEGHWVSFDWQATEQEERLVRRSKPVAITARSEGDVLVIEGPSPMLTDRGEPNGRRGTWRLDLRRSNMPGESLRLAGRAVHTELTGPEGVPVELARTFRTWSRN